MSGSELDLGEIAVTIAGALWSIGGGRLRFLFLKVWTVFCAWIRTGGPMEGVCSSSLTFLPLSSPKFILEGTSSFSSVSVPQLIDFGSFDLPF